MGRHAEAQKQRVSRPRLLELLRVPYVIVDMLTMLISGMLLIANTERVHIHIIIAEARITSASP